MHMNMIETIQQIKSKGRSTFVSILDRLYREKNILERKKDSKEDMGELLDNLKKARNEWVMATTNYEFAHEDELIDYYAYLIKASQIKYDYLLKKVKEKGFKVEFDEPYSLKIGKSQGIY